MRDAIKIDVWSDIACPWCYIGKRNLETAWPRFATTATASRSSTTRFELSPDTPVDFEGARGRLPRKHKGMSADQVEQMLERVDRRRSAMPGLTYRFDPLQHTNTVKAHELLHFAKAHGRQLEMAERLMSAYFTEGRHLGRERRARRPRRRPPDSTPDAARDALPSEPLPPSRAAPIRRRRRVRHQRRAVLRDRRQVRGVRRAASRGVRADRARPGAGREGAAPHDETAEARRLPDAVRRRRFGRDACDGDVCVHRRASPAGGTLHLVASA